MRRRVIPKRTDIRSIRAQEQATTDLRLSDVYSWQRALDVPVSELLVDETESLSRPVRERAAMLKIMKTARSLVEASHPGPAKRMADNLVEQLLDLMPELKEQLLLRLLKGVVLSSLRQ